MTWSALREALAALLVDGADQPAGGVDPSISGVAYDSRRVAPGHVFVALQGRHADGLAFVTEALKARRAAAAQAPKETALADRLANALNAAEAAS